MNRVLTYWLNIEEKINNLKFRERAVIFIAALAVILILWNAIIYTPISTKNDNLEAQLKAIKLSIEKSTNEEHVLTLALQNDPNTNKKREIKRVEKSIKLLEGDMIEMSSGLIVAESFPRVLSQMLHKENGIKVLEFNMLPVEELLLPVPENGAEGVEREDMLASDENVQNQARLYRHAVDFKIRANFFRTIEYLKKVENMRWRIYWGRLDYQVSSYPDAVVHIQAYSISSSRGKFGDVK